MNDKESVNLKFREMVEKSIAKVATEYNEDFISEEIREAFDGALEDSIKQILGLRKDRYAGWVITDPYGRKSEFSKFVMESVSGSLQTMFSQISFDDMVLSPSQIKAVKKAYKDKLFDSMLIRVQEEAEEVAKTTIQSVLEQEVILVNKVSTLSDEQILELAKQRNLI